MNKTTQKQIEAAIKRGNRVLKMRAKSPKMTWREIGERLKVSTERARQIGKKAEDRAKNG